MCNNTHGSYNCTCKEGYYGDGLSCTGNKLTSSFPWQIYFSEFNLLSACLQVLKWPGSCFRVKRIYSLKRDIVSIKSKNEVIHRLQIWRRMHESEALRRQPLLRANPLTRSLVRARVVYTFIQAISSKISQEKSCLWEDMVYQSIFNTSEANLRSVN